MRTRVFRVAIETAKIMIFFTLGKKIAENAFFILLMVKYVGVAVSIKRPLKVALALAVGS